MIQIDLFLVFHSCKKKKRAIEKILIGCNLMLQSFAYKRDQFIVAGTKEAIKQLKQANKLKDLDVYKLTNVF